MKVGRRASSRIFCNCYWYLPAYELPASVFAYAAPQSVFRIDPPPTHLPTLPAALPPRLQTGASAIVPMEIASSKKEYVFKPPKDM